MWKHVCPGISFDEKETKVHLNIPQLLQAYGYKRTEEKNLRIVHSVLKKVFLVLLGDETAGYVLSSVMATLKKHSLEDVKIDIKPR